MSRLFGNGTAVNNNADSAPAKGYFEDNDADGIYTAGIDTLVDEYNSRLDANGVSTHVKANTANVKPRIKAAVDFTSIIDFGTTAALETKNDLTLAGQMRDCAECHVGGGAMQYVPKSGATDLSAGTCEDATVVYGGVTYQSATAETGTPVACSAATGPTTEAEQYDPDFAQCGMYNSSRGMRNFICVPNPANQRQDLRTASFTGVNAFNYFIDQFDEDEDGVLGEALPQDYSQTGVLEMDCLMCHLDGYAYEERNEAIRKGKFDASRAVGAEIGTVITGTTVAYDPAVVGISTSGSSLNALTLGESGLHVHGMPSANCANCHTDMHSVDWKKRGDSWGVPYTADVHGSLECVSCHSRKDETYYAGAWRTYNDLTKLTGQGGSSLLGHDPAKGSAPYSSLWNNTDNSMKNCEDCHFGLVADNAGAANPTAKHEALGLTSMVLQTGTDGTKDASHIDVLDCSTCHVRKLGHGPTAAEGGVTHGSLYEWGTGGAMVDSTGPDAEGRVTDHENLYVERTMENNLALAWQGGKLIKTNALVTMFWRDKDEDFTNAGAAGFVDINADGQTGGMDAVNPSHVRDAMAAAALPALTVDGAITAAEVQAQRAALTAYLPSVGINLDPDGDSTSNAKLKLSFMGVMFKVNHNVSPAQYAYGKGGCTDCHASGAGFYNGTYQMKPRDLNITYAATDAVPFTKVNMNDYNTDGVFGNVPADFQMTDFHPTLFAKASQGNARSIALSIRNGAGGTTLRDIDRAEALWETTLNAPITTTTDDTVKATRGEMVAYLDNITGTPSVHSRHAAAGAGKCTNCHDDGAGAIDFGSVSDVGQPLDRNGAVATFTYTPDPLGNPGTCSTNSCHGSWGFSMSNPWVKPSFTPFFSTLSSMNNNLEVSLNATRTKCPNGCDFTIDPDVSDGIPGVADADGVLVHTYSGAGDYTASVIACDQVTNECRQAEATATAKIVTAIDPAAGDFTVADTGIREATVTAVGTFPTTSIARAYIYWGDRKTTTVTTPATLDAGIIHSYRRAGTYDIMVRVYDTLRNQTDITYTVVID
ncbi:MAG: hypothetical protein V1706_09790 [Pseudomonadota bacterium]